MPNWAAVQLAENDGEETVVHLARKVKPRQADRITELLPRYLMMINWADSGPGYSWPVAYYVTWLPLFERYVVTQSADSPDAYGYCDFAIGHFGASDDYVSDAGTVIKSDWEWQRDEFTQHAWAYLFGTGLIDETSAQVLRHEVWFNDDC